MAPPLRVARAAIILLAVLLPVSAAADIVHLKNGQQLEGLAEEAGDQVRIRLAAGSVVLKKDQVERIELSDAEWNRALGEKWERARSEDEKRIKGYELEPQTVPVTTDRSALFVEAVINGRLKARLLVDTGASDVLLTRQAARDLGLDLDPRRTVMTQVADGRFVKSIYHKLDSIRIQDSEARGVNANVLMEDAPEIGFGDGLLGMSFLSRFNFSVNSKDNQLILEKLS